MTKEVTNFDEYLNTIANPAHRNELAQVLDWVSRQYPQLTKIIAWNQPMFTDHGTFIIGFSVAKGHFSVAPEQKAIQKFKTVFDERQLSYGKALVRFQWGGHTDFDLLDKMITYNISDKQDISNFWRK